MFNNQKFLETTKQVDDLANDIEQEVSNLFDKYVEDFKIDRQLNHELASDLNSKIKENKKLKRSKVAWRVWSWLCFGLTILSLVVHFIINNSLVIIATVLLAVLTIFLFVFGHQSIKKINDNVKKNDEVIDDLHSKICDQVAPIINSFSYSNIFSLISKKWKDIAFNNCFTIDKQLQMVDAFNTLHSTTSKNIRQENFFFSNAKPKKQCFYETPIVTRSWFTKFSQKMYANQLMRNDADLGKLLTRCSFQNLLSGQLCNHPFIFYSCLLQDWIIQIYSGSTTVKVGDKTTTVVAHFPWPRPIWKKSEDTLAFKSNVALELSFLPTSQNRKLFEKINIVNPIENMPMENRDFDKAFPVIRNDEQGYRIVFSPLAQENFITLLNNLPLIVKKDKSITYVSLLTKEDSSIGFNGSSCFEYDLDEFKERLVNTVKHFTTTIGYCQLTLTNIPAYCQEYELDLKKAVNKNNAPSEIEIEALMNKNNMFGLEGVTPTIINTEIIQTTTVDKMPVSIAKVYAFSFDPVSKVKMVLTQGTSVPVHYVDYMPVVKNCFAVAINIQGQTVDLVDDDLIVEHGVLCYKCDSCPTSSQIKARIKSIISKFNQD